MLSKCSHILQHFECVVESPHYTNTSQPYIPVKFTRKSAHSPLFSLLVHPLSSSKLQHCSLGSPSAKLSMHWQPLLSAEASAQPADEELPLPLCKPPDTDPNSSPVTRDARSFTRYSLHCCCLGNPLCRNNHSHTPPIGWGYGAYIHLLP